MSPRLLVASDLHIGSGLNYSTSPAGRLADQGNVWERCCEEAVERDVDGFLFAGDLFNRPKPSPAEYLCAIRGLRWLAQAKIPTLIIPGNHDVAGASDEACALDVLAPWATISKRPGVFDIGGVKVATLPWTSKARLAAQFDGSDVDAPAQSVAERLVDVAVGLRADADVLLLHWSLSGAVTSSGVETDEFREVLIDRHAIRAQEWDAVFAGHIHRRQTVIPDGYYLGSLCVSDFSEGDQAHGFAIYDTQNTDVEWVEVDQRRFVTLDKVIDEIGNWCFETDGLEDAVVRARYACSEEQRKQIDHRDIEAALYAAGAHRVYSIEATVQKPTRARVEQASLDLTPDEALTLWITYQAIEPPRAERMRVEAASYEVAS